MRPYTYYPRTRFQPVTASFVAPVLPSFYTRNVNPVNQAPAVNILRDETAYVIRLAVPGMTKENIKIEINEDQLIISATEVQPENKPNYVRHEFNYHGFKRSFGLHKQANIDAMTASFDQGILTIVVPDKAPETRKIEIL